MFIPIPSDFHFFYREHSTLYIISTHDLKIISRYIKNYPKYQKPMLSQFILCKHLHKIRNNFDARPIRSSLNLILHRPIQQIMICYFTTQSNHFKTLSKQISLSSNNNNYLKCQNKINIEIHSSSKIDINKHSKYSLPFTTWSYDFKR